MFIVRPSLKYVVNLLADEIYFYNRFSKDLRIVSLRHLEFPENMLKQSGNDHSRRTHSSIINTFLVCTLSGFLDPEEYIQ